MGTKGRGKLIRRIYQACLLLALGMPVAQGSTIAFRVVNTNTTAGSYLLPDPASNCAKLEEVWSAHPSSYGRFEATLVPFGETTSVWTGLGCRLRELRLSDGQWWVKGTYPITIGPYCNTPSTPQFDFAQQKCVGFPAPDKSAGPSCPNGTNPIDGATGRKYQIETDFIGMGSFPLRWERTYNSRGVGAVDMGNGWLHSYASSVRLVPNTSPQRAIVLRPSGRALTFHAAGGAWSGDPDVADRLESLGTGWRFTTAGGEIELFNEAGSLLQRSSVLGETHVLTYSEGRLTGVQDGHGRTLAIGYDLGGRIAAVTAADGSTYGYSYDGLNNLAAVQKPDQTSRLYFYENTQFPSALTGITDERGIRYATWTYDSEGRAISSEHAGGADRHTLTYNADGSTTVTNALGKQTTYHFTTVQGVRKVSQVEGHPSASCVGANQAYTYTPEGWLAGKTDWKGVSTTYQYNGRGLEISRTEAAGTPQARTITTDWHPTLRLPVTISEPQQITTFGYDDKGRLLSRQVQPR